MCHAVIRLSISRVNRESENERIANCKILLFFIRFCPFHLKQQYKRTPRIKSRQYFYQMKHNTNSNSCVYSHIDLLKSIQKLCLWPINKNIDSWKCCQRCKCKLDLNLMVESLAFPHSSHHLLLSVTSQVSWNAAKLIMCIFDH